MRRISKPTLLLDKQKCLKNIENMTRKASKHNLSFRPHFKTHQSKQIGEWFRDFGVNRITVSSVQMAKYFADSGWNNITIAFPFNQLEIDEINDLAEKITLNLLLIHKESVEFLNKHLKHEVGVFIKIDSGYHRCGILTTNTQEIDELVNSISSSAKLCLSGFLTHSGQTYHATSPKQVRAIHETATYNMNLLKKRYASQFPDAVISIGDTPSCSLSDSFDGIDEIRPGNFVFYDVMQFKHRICRSDQIVIALACPIVSKNKQRNELIIYGGGVHLSKEFITHKDGSKNFGLVVQFSEKGWSDPLPGIHVSSISQEHGTIKGLFGQLEQFQIGDLIGILPIHSCMTANLMGEYLTLDGEFLEHM